MAGPNAEDPPPPDDVDKQAWRDALRCERLRIKLLINMGFDQSRKAVSDEYYRLIDRVGWRLVLRAGEALRSSGPQVGGRQAKVAAARKRLNENDRQVWQSGFLTMWVWHRRRQCPVGQGGFHVGAVRQLPERAPSWSESAGCPDRTIFYVYDCGSDPRRHVDREIDEIISSWPGGTLDLLYLSHFDRDHMCGIPRLVHPKKGLNPDTIILPYVDEVERIIAFARAGHMHGRRATADRFFTNMIIDPVETLRGLGPRQIIFIAGEGEVPFPEDTPPVDPPTAGGEGNSWKLGPPDDSSRRRVRAWRPDGADAVVVQGGIFTLFGADYEATWTLIPYVQRADPGAVDRFKLAAEALLDWEPGSFATQVKRPDVRRRLVSKYRVKLARAYRHGFGDKTLTSLCLYSGPRDPHLAGAVQLHPSLPVADIPRVAWLGTGDANLRDPIAISVFETHFRSVLPYVETFALPHHGSIHNTDPNRLVGNPDIWVASAEPSNPKWEHPAEALKTAVRRRKKIFRHVSSLSDSALDERLLVYWPN